MRTADFDYELPEELVAQSPVLERDQSRLLVLHRNSGKLEHRIFRDLPDYLLPGDVLVLNDSRVIPARIRGTNAASGGQFEILLLEENAINDWWVMLRPGRRARIGTRIVVEPPAEEHEEISAVVTATNPEGHRRLHFSGTRNILEQLEQIGEVPLPPYISRPAGAHDEKDRQRYQTVYARPSGSVAAPTAGLHFTQELLEMIRARGITVCSVTLHVGLGTFAPVKTESISGHTMHEERFELPESTAKAINDAKQQGRRVIAVGTTSVRVLETAAQCHGGRLTPGPGRTRIFLYPPRAFRIVDVLLTNFHLPRSTLLMLVSAFAAPGDTKGLEVVRRAYREAIQERYRFFSYGDAMLIL